MSGPPMCNVQSEQGFICTEDQDHTDDHFDCAVVPVPGSRWPNFLEDQQARKARRERGDYPGSQVAKMWMDEQAERRRLAAETAP